MYNINESYGDRKISKSADQLPQTSIQQFILTLFYLVLVDPSGIAWVRDA